jgi:hypothetical protein
MSRAIPSHMRGVSRSSRTLGAGCGGRELRFRRWRGQRTAKSCGPDASTLASSWRKFSSAGDGDKKARSPGRARRKPLKPLRAGMPGDSGCNRGDYARVVFIFPTRGCGCNGARHSPRPRFRGRTNDARLGRASVARTNRVDASSRLRQSQSIATKPRRRHAPRGG